MEQTMQGTVVEKAPPQTVLLNFRAQPEDAADLRSEAERQRTTVSSLVRGALVQVGLLKSHPKEGNTEQEVNHGL